MNAVVIVAGGSGRRLAGPLPKQYVPLGGKAMVLHSIDRFFSFDPGIRLVLVLAEGHKRYWEDVSASCSRSKEILLAEGGETRFDSVKKGLDLLEDGWIVGIHDAVRPFVSLQTIRRCYESAKFSGSGVPVIEMDESVRMVDYPSGTGSIHTSGRSSRRVSDPTPGLRSKHLDRSRLRRVQTPQVFRSEMIKSAYSRVRDPSFTDDASVFETMFGNVSLVEGNIENIKITTRVDLELASLLFRKV